MAKEKRVDGMLQMGYGTWNHPGDEAYRATLWALEAGCHHIDGAQGYDNEADVGRAIKDSGIARDDVHITTKVKPENFAPGLVLSSTEQSVEKLGLGPVDMLLLHYPSVGGEYPMEEYMAQFAECLDSGLTKTIGLSNFTIPLIDQAVKLLGARKVMTNQVESHVYMQNDAIVEHCKKLGIAITAFCPLARGAVLDDPVLTAIGKNHGASAAQISLAYLMGIGQIVIPSSGKKQRIIENFAARNIVLSQDEMAQCRNLEKGLRLVDGAWCPKWDEYSRT
ncbi:MAG: aldo/keto reductase [Rhizobiales bacterium]|nr:aldo/keto reductase [Hyphomicrobiales bacterium]NRB15619.1 aldo/keto reductase [Hyphomicrobiales bacterium]